MFAESFMLIPDIIQTSRVPASFKPAFSWYALHLDIVPKLYYLDIALELYYLDIAPELYCLDIAPELYCNSHKSC